MREIKTHRLPDQEPDKPRQLLPSCLNDLIRIEPGDDPVNPSITNRTVDSYYLFLNAGGWNQFLNVKFQGQPLVEGTPDGGTKYNQPKGVSCESLIAIVIDRLGSFQRTHLKCEQNDLAIKNLKEALTWLQNKTQERLDRGVEGTNKP